MGLYTQAGVSVESWVEMTDNVPMRYEVDHLNNRATLYFGHEDEFVLSLCRDNWNQVLTLGSTAMSELDNPPPTEQ